MPCCRQKMPVNVKCLAPAKYAFLEMHGALGFFSILGNLSPAYSVEEQKSTASMAKGCVFSI